jgi:hypothetical protein
MSVRCQLRKSTFGQESLAHYVFVGRSVGLAAATYAARKFLIS